MREKTRVTQTILERLDNYMLKLRGRVVRMEDNRWPNGITTWSPERRLRRGRPEVSRKRKWKGSCGAEQFTCDDATNRQIWQLKTSKRWTTDKLTDKNM
jgi:hypothetical protein